MSPFILRLSSSTNFWAKTSKDGLDVAFMTPEKLTVLVNQTK